MRNNIFQGDNGFSLIELMVIVAIISVLAAIAIPNYISYRNKSYCSLAETDAANVGRALTAYYSIPTRVNLPTPSDLKIGVNNPVDITGDPNTTITIIVTDKSHRCPDNYQDVMPGWDATSDYYVFYVR